MWFYGFFWRIDRVEKFVSVIFEFFSGVDVEKGDWGFVVNICNLVLLSGKYL